METQIKQDLAGNVAQVKGDEIRGLPVTNAGKPGGRL